MILLGSQIQLKHFTTKTGSLASAKVRCNFKLHWICLLYEPQLVVGFWSFMQIVMAWVNLNLNCLHTQYVSAQKKPQRTRVLGPMSNWACSSKCLKLKYYLSHFYAWCSWHSLSSFYLKSFLTRNKIPVHVV